MILIRGITEVKTALLHTLFYVKLKRKNFLSFYMHENREQETVFT